MIHYSVILALTLNPVALSVVNIPSVITVPTVLGPKS
jgi:hypothetical protein